MNSKKSSLKSKISEIAKFDSTLLTPKSEITNTLGNDENYLKEVLELTKSDLIRLERIGAAIKARYAMENKTSAAKTGPHRTRWILIKEEIVGAKNDT